MDGLENLFMEDEIDEDILNPVDLRNGQHVELPEEADPNPFHVENHMVNGGGVVERRQDFLHFGDDPEDDEEIMEIDVGLPWVNNPADIEIMEEEPVQDLDPVSENGNDDIVGNANGNGLDPDLENGQGDRLGHANGIGLPAYNLNIIQEEIQRYRELFGLPDDFLAVGDNINMDGGIEDMNNENYDDGAHLEALNAMNEGVELDVAGIDEDFINFDLHNDSSDDTVSASGDTPNGDDTSSTTISTLSDNDSTTSSSVSNGSEESSSEDSSDQDSTLSTTTTTDDGNNDYGNYHADNEEEETDEELPPEEPHVKKRKQN